MWVEMKYLIYCQRTNRYLATYTNAKTLETLDTSRCYFEEYDEKKVNDLVKKSKAKNAKTTISFKSKNSSDDCTNIINTTGYISAVSSLDSYSSSSSGCDSSSGSSYDSSSSSSCDSSSW